MPLKVFKYMSVFLRTGFSKTARLFARGPHLFAIWPSSSDRPPLPFRFELYVRPPKCYVLRRRATSTFYAPSTL